MTHLSLNRTDLSFETDGEDKTFVIDISRFAKQRLISALVTIYISRNLLFHWDPPGLIDERHHEVEFSIDIQ